MVRDPSDHWPLYCVTKKNRQKTPSCLWGSAQLRLCCWHHPLCCHPSVYSVVCPLSHLSAHSSFCPLSHLSTHSFFCPSLSPHLSGLMTPHVISAAKLNPDLQQHPSNSPPALCDSHRGSASLSAPCLASTSCKACLNSFFYPTCNIYLPCGE